MEVKGLELVSTTTVAMKTRSDLLVPIARKIRCLDLEDQRLYNVPLEAWSIKGISDISDRLGRPMMMDQMTSDMCKEGSGRLGYARVGESEKRNSKNIDHLDNSEEGFMEVKNKKNRNGINDSMLNGGNGNKQGKSQVQNQVKYAFKPKNPVPKPPFVEPRNKQCSPLKVQSLNIDKR
nr:zinc knuckle CX2CX4HX4C [Tanacetum cinerariifolium]